MFLTKGAAKLGCEPVIQVKQPLRANDRSEVNEVNNRILQSDSGPALNYYK